MTASTSTSGALARRLPVLTLGVAVAGLALAAESPEDWLARMTTALEQLNYRGTLVHSHDGKIETLSITHRYRDGVVKEKLEALDGVGSVIIRDGDEVKCILPETRSVLVERRAEGAALFGSVPQSIETLSKSYDLALVRRERMAGRQTMQLAIRPRDGFRYAHRLWLDEATGMPIRNQLLDPAGKVVEDVRFADVEIGGTIAAAALQPQVDTSDFAWFRRPGPERRPSGAHDAGWHAAELPPGFFLISAREKRLAGAKGTVEHIVYSDGLATVSVFVESPEYDAERLEGASRVGATNTYSTWTGGHQVTAVGTVPARTVRVIARTLRPREAP